MSAAKDAAILYFALHGTDAPLACKEWNEGRKCTRPLAGCDPSDGTPLCVEHIERCQGHVFDEDTIAEIWIVKTTLDSMRGRTSPQSSLETFALRVAGIEPASPEDTIPAPPPSRGEDSIQKDERNGRQ